MSQVICFWDKSKLQVNNQQGDQIKQAILNDSIKGFMIGGNYYAIGGIEKIISKEDAYDIFPTEYELLKNMTEEKATLPQLGSQELKQLENPFN